MVPGFLREIFVICTFQREGEGREIRGAQIEVLPKLPPCELLRTNHIVSTARDHGVVQSIKICMSATDARFGLQSCPEDFGDLTSDYSEISTRGAL